MRIESRRFAHPQNHHKGWFRVFRFKGMVEVWFGHRWIMLEYR